METGFEFRKQAYKAMDLKLPDAPPKRVLLLFRDTARRNIVRVPLTAECVHVCVHVCVHLCGSGSCCAACQCLPRLPEASSEESALVLLPPLLLGSHHRYHHRYHYHYHYHHSPLVLPCVSLPVLSACCVSYVWTWLSRMDPVAVWLLSICRGWTPSLCGSSRISMPHVHPSCCYCRQVNTQELIQIVESYNLSYT
jgi:hypothetical protein